MIPPASYTNPSKVEDKDDMPVDSGTNENTNSTNIDSNINDGTIGAENKPGDECNETLSKNINSLEQTEHAATESSPSLDSTETLSTQLENVVCPSKDDTEDTYREETDVTLEEVAKECCPIGNDIETIFKYDSYSQ